MFRTQKYFEWIIIYLICKICLGKMDGLNIMQWNLDDRYSVFWSQLTFVSRLPKPTDSNDHCYRLSYFRSCNNYLTFQVFKTSFNDIMLQSLHLTTKDVEHFDWFIIFGLTWGNSCFLFFRNWVPVHADRAFVPWSRIYQPQHHLLYLLKDYYV